MMDFLSNTEWQFIINTGIAILGICIGAWIALRRPPQIPLSYEAIEIKPGFEAEDEVKELLKKIGMSVDDKLLPLFCLVTFKIWNSGRDSITLPENSKPLTIAFKSGATILYCEKCETVPHDLEFTFKANAEKLCVTFPLLDPQESITFKVLITDYVNYFPAVYVRVPGKKRIIRANNIRRSREMRILGAVALCGAIGMYIGFGSVPHNAMSEFYFIGRAAVLLGYGVVFLLASWIDRRMAPYPSFFMLPSTLLYIYWRIFLRLLPALAATAITATAIYFLLGLQALSIVFVVMMLICTFFIIWYEIYIFLRWFLKKRKKSYNNLLIVILTGLPSYAFLGMCIYVFVQVLLGK